VKRFLAVFACCGLLALSSCSDDSSSSADPPSPTPTSTSSQPSPTQEVETPEEFVRRWVEVSNEMQNTGETKVYRSISRGCRPCTAVADQVERYFEAGGYVKTDGWSISSLKLSKPGAAGRVTATVEVESAPTQYKESAEADAQALEGGSVIELMTIEPYSNSWVLTNLEQQAQ
jgi:hypothetical protein